MIFSIIVIIAIVAVGIYVTNFFLSVNKCSEIGFFYEDLEGEVDKAWKSTIYRGDFSLDSLQGIEYFCFGSLQKTGIDEKSEEIRQEIDELVYVSNKTNIFLHPLEKACDGDAAYNVLEHVDIEGFFCIETDIEELKVRLEKEAEDALVKVKKSI
jgi:hypothetical protein